MQMLIHFVCVYAYLNAMCVCVYERGVCPCRACATCGRNRARLGADNCHQWCKETVLFPSDLLLFLFLKKLN